MSEERFNAGEELLLEVLNESFWRRRSGGWDAGALMAGEDDELGGGGVPRGGEIRLTGRLERQKSDERVRSSLKFLGGCRFVS